MARTFSAVPPALMQQPISWRIGVVATDRAQRSTGDKADLPPKQSQFLRVQGARFSPRRDPCPPENLIRHPVSNPGKAALQKKHSLNRRPGVSPNELAHYALGEFRRMNFRRAFRPTTLAPFSRDGSEPDQTAGRRERPAPAFLLEHEVIVFSGFEPSRLRRAGCRSFRDECRASCRRRRRTAFACRERQSGEAVA